MIGYIYKTTNLINNKIYIGQHKCSHFDTKYYGSGKLLKKAIDKYGISNFNCLLLEECFSEEELNKKEIYYICLYKSTQPDIGYNLSDGGFVPRLSGIHNPMFGKHPIRNKELNKQVSDKLKGHAYWSVKHHSEETKRKLSILSHKRNLQRSKEFYRNWADKQIGKKMMNNGNECHWVLPREFDKYLKEGYVFGGLKRIRKPTNQNHNQGKVRIHKNKVNKFVKPEDLEKYLNDGWIKGGYQKNKNIANE